MKRTVNISIHHCGLCPHCETDCNQTMLQCGHYGKRICWIDESMEGDFFNGVPEWCPLYKKQMEEKNSIKKIVYLSRSYSIVIHTNWVGVDGCPRSMTVTGIPNEEAAKRFVEFMGWKSVPMDIVDN